VRRERGTKPSRRLCPHSSRGVRDPGSRCEKIPVFASWEALRITEAEVPRYWYNGQNIGVLCGEPSGWLVDVDLDAEEAVKIAFRFLPPTLTSARGSRPHSHCWYIAPGAENDDWKDTTGKKIVELRSTGRQTIAPPSTHPDGDVYVWHPGLKMAEVSADELEERCRELATAALIARHVPPEGSRHDFALALAGFLLRPGRLEEGLALKMLDAAWLAAGADSREALRDLEGIVADTVENLEAGERVVGRPTLEEYAPGIVRLLCRWWGWSKQDPQPEPVQEKEERRNQADRLITYALKDVQELFVDQHGAPHAL
jgi:putative DNA primase/helicase